MRIRWLFLSRVSIINTSMIFKKARREAERGALVVGLLPARTDTAWFHEYVYRAATEIRFLKGRLKFEGAAASAPFPSMIVVWGRM